MIRHLSITLALFAAPALARAAPAAAPAPAATTLPHISIVATGRGSPVVLIPGLSTPRAVWDGIVTDLAKKHRVILVQINGFGGDAAGANLAPGLLDGVVAEVDDYLRAQKLKPAKVVGHSLGGLVSLMLAKAHPADVSGVMVVDALPFIGTLFAHDATVASVAPRAAMIRDAMAATYGRPGDPAAAAAVANGLALKPESRAKIVAWLGHVDPRVSAQALYEDMTTDLRPAMAGIAVPITMVYPWSAALPRAQADAIYRAAYSGAPRVTFVPVADSAHFVMLDQPAAFAAAVDSFLR